MLANTNDVALDMLLNDKPAVAEVGKAKDNDVPLKKAEIIAATNANDGTELDKGEVAAATTLMIVQNWWTRVKLLPFLMLTRVMLWVPLMRRKMQSC